MSPKPIRNFCIIAHIDHGKSTIADRLLESTGALADRDKQAQYLDKMDIERERGITIKAQAVRLPYTAADGQEYRFNLIDTPGHVDFHYEVSRALSACEGALLIVDASQGIQAQTVANALAAMDQNLELIPVLNKIDLPNADVAKVTAELVETFGFNADECLAMSAKTGEGVDAVLEAIVDRCPPPNVEDRTDDKLAALLIDSWYDNYQGVVMLVRVVRGTMCCGDAIRLMATDEEQDIIKLGVFSPQPVSVDQLAAGDVGFIVTGIRDVRKTLIGDTITLVKNPTQDPLDGFKPAQPIVFSGLFPTDSAQYENLRTALEKLRLNDASFDFEPETSTALGFGFRCGFLGSLHMEIIQERLEREYNLDLICTAPSVAYRVIDAHGEVTVISNPAEWPDAGSIGSIEEPYTRVTIHAPKEYVGNIMKLCQERRGEQERLDYYGADRVGIIYALPLSELIFDFHDKLKSITRGYASLEYDVAGYRPGSLVKLAIMINGDSVDALSVITHRESAYYRGREVCSTLKGEIPRQMFDIAIQASIGTRIISRETVKALRKNVTAKCYGGDISRKRKLLEKQKAGKKRMKHVGNVEVPQEAFMSVLKVKDT